MPYLIGFGYDTKNSLEADALSVSAPIPSAGRPADVAIRFRRSHQDPSCSALIAHAFDAVRYPDSAH